jgi:hypothetical protein
MATWIVCFHIPDLAVRSLNENLLDKVVVSWAGQVWSWSETLEKSGLRTGDSLQRARALCPDALLLERDLHREVMLRERLLNQLYSASPRVTLSNETSLPGAWGLLQNPLANRLRQLMQELRARVGVSRYRSHAMLAAAKASPGEHVVVKPADLMPFLRETSVGVLIPLGYADVVDALALFGLRSLLQVYQLTRRHLEAQFEEQGKTLYALLHPNDELPIPVYEPGVIQAEFDLDASILENLDLAPQLTYLVDQVIDQLKGKSAQYLELQLRTEKGRVEACRLLKEPVRDHRRLITVAQYLLSDLMPKASEVCGLGVSLGGLVDTPFRQGSLFAMRKPVLNALRAVERRFPSKLLRGIVVDPQPIFHEEQTRFEPIFSGDTIT